MTVLQLPLASHSVNSLNVRNVNRASANVRSSQPIVVRPDPLDHRDLLENVDRTVFPANVVNPDAMHSKSRSPKTRSASNALPDHPVHPDSLVIPVIPDLKANPADPEIAAILAHLDHPENREILETLVALETPERLDNLARTQNPVSDSLVPKARLVCLVRMVNQVVMEPNHMARQHLVSLVHPETLDVMDNLVVLDSPEVLAVLVHLVTTLSTAHAHHGALRW